MQVDALTLTEYLLGSLDEHERVQVEAALASSPALRAELRALAEVFGEVAAELPPELPSPSGRDRLLAAVAPRPRLASVVDALARFVDMTREAAAALLASVDEATRWHPTPWAGIRVFHIEPGPRIADAEVGFVHMAPGARFPWHATTGTKRTWCCKAPCRSPTAAWWGRARSTWATRRWSTTAARGRTDGWRSADGQPELGEPAPGCAT